MENTYLLQKNTYLNTSSSNWASTLHWLYSTLHTYCTHNTPHLLYSQQNEMKFFIRVTSIYSLKVNRQNGIIIF